MLNGLPLCILVLIVRVIPCAALPNLNIKETLSSFTSMRHSWMPRSNSPILGRQTIAGVNYNPNGSAFLWLPQDEYSGQNFFDRWDFFSFPDPTNGNVNFVNRTTAFANGLVYIQDDGSVIMKADNTSSLASGVFRDSVRITSQTSYDTGLFILDLNRAPWGCAVWPAFWTVGSDWPANGEIDILEGVHDDQHNQIAWHTAPGCELNPNVTFSGTMNALNGVNLTSCDAKLNSNSGCDVTEWSRASYGPLFEASGGGVIAMKWDENDISVWSFFRAAVPADITQGSPDPSEWGIPSATLSNSSCHIGQFFSNHSIVFDITFCGDWAGSSYATSGCPGTCAERLMDGANFVNASWSINSLKVYKKQLFAGNSTTKVSASAGLLDWVGFSQITLLVLLALAHVYVW
ncbi:glycoside hydrolase family 16 protein [Phlegmacium glaucopus]|nr:glycoside hydrolase family 16 protein [Phlegmacium glaucopus]